MPARVAHHTEQTNELKHELKPVKISDSNQSHMALRPNAHALMLLPFSAAARAS